MEGKDFWKTTFSWVILQYLNVLTPICYISGISRTVVCGKKSKIYFLISDDVIHGRLLMTSHKSETTPVRLPIRHMTSITWRHQYEISRDESHYSRKTGNWASVIFGKKIQTRLGTSGSVIYGKKSQKRLFRVIWREKISFQNFRILGTELASFLEKKSRRIF